MISTLDFTLEFITDDSKVKEIANKLTKETIEDRTITSEDIALKDLIS